MARLLGRDVDKPCWMGLRQLQAKHTSSSVTVIFSRGNRDDYASQAPADVQITVGVMDPVGCVAVAAQDRYNLAMLRRRKGETLLALLTRLDQAIDQAQTLGIFTDEINH